MFYFCSNLFKNMEKSIKIRKKHPEDEDLAETIMAWVAVRCKADRISKSFYSKVINGIPNRLKLLDKKILILIL